MSEGEQADQLAAAAEAAPAAEATALPESDILEFALRSPIAAYKEEVQTLKLRRPTGADLIAVVRNPVIFTPSIYPPEVRHDLPRVVSLVARLSKVPSSSLGKMAPLELATLAWAISPWLMPPPKSNGQWRDDHIEFQLDKPVTVTLKKDDQKEFSALMIRRPEANDMLEIGNPVLDSPFVDPPETRHDYPKLAGMLARLAEVPVTLFNEISARELIDLAWAVTPFFSVVA
jgi:hypothetical protein